MTCEASDTDGTWLQRVKQRIFAGAWSREAVLGSAVGLIAFLVLVPLAYLLWKAFFPSGALTLQGFAEAFGDEQAVRMVIDTLVYALGSTILAVVTGTVLAYINVRTDVPFKAGLFLSSLVPLVMPAILYAPAWIFLASPEIGLFNQVLSPLFGGAPFNIFSMAGMIWVSGLHLSPIMFLVMAAAFRSMDPSLEEAAEMSGAGRFDIMRRITLPLMRPAIVGGSLVVLVLAFENFDVPALIGIPSGIYVFTTRIYFLLGLFPARLGAAGALGVSLIVIMIVFMALSKIGAGKAASYQTVTGKAFRPRVRNLGRLRPWVGLAVSIYFFTAVLAPLFSLVYVSILPYFQGLSWEVFSAFTLENFIALADEPVVYRAFANTVVLAIASATAVMILTTLAGWIVARSRMRGRIMVDALSMAPLIIPGVVLGLALSFTYLRLPIPVYGTLWILLVAYVTRYIPFGMRYAVTSMSQISDQLEESAYVAGASWWQTFRKIILPLSAPGIVAGWIFVVMVSFRELGASILLYSAGTEVVSVLIYQEYVNGALNQVAALGVLMVILLSVVISLAYGIGSRFGVRVQ